MQEQNTPQDPIPVSGDANAPESVTSAEGTVDSTPSLEDLLRQAELNAQEHHDAWLRAKAETENMRRRAQEDIAKASKFAIEKFAEALLPVKDTLEMALADCPCGLLLVSHDRRLLDELCHQCLFVEAPNAILRPGNYSQGLLQAEMDEASARRARAAALPSAGVGRPPGA